MHRKQAFILKLGKDDGILSNLAQACIHHNSNKN